MNQNPFARLARQVESKHLIVSLVGGTTGSAGEKMVVLLLAKALRVRAESMVLTDGRSYHAFKIAEYACGSAPTVMHLRDCRCGTGDFCQDLRRARRSAGLFFDEFVIGVGEARRNNIVDLACVVVAFEGAEEHRARAEARKIPVFYVPAETTIAQARVIVDRIVKKL